MLQLVYQVPGQVNCKKVTQLNCQRNLQDPIQESHQLIFQKEPIRYTRGFPIDIPSIMAVIDPNKSPSTDTGFVHSIGGPGVNPSYKTTKDTSPVKIIKLPSVNSKTPTKYPSHVPK